LSEGVAEGEPDVCDLRGQNEKIADEVVIDRRTRPRPVLCLDTCELLMAVQCLPQRRVVHVEALNRIRTFLAATPDRLQVVVTDLVPHEFAQNLAEVQKKAKEFLVQADKDSTLVHGAWSHLSSPLGSIPSAHAANTLVNELTGLAQAVMAQARVLDSDPTCVHRALDRVLAKRRPSHDDRVKDSIHLEHYLELSRLLHTGGFTERRVFVSGNRSDFWDAPLPRIHASIAPEMAAVGLEFFGDLRSAMGSLRI
jgi:hypothetical protein